MDEDRERAYRERIRALEQALAEAESRAALAEQLVEHAPIAITVANTDGTLALMNRAAQTFMALPDRSAVGRFNVLSHPRNIENGFAEVYRRALDGQVVELPEFQAELERARAEFGAQGPSRWFSQVVFPVRDAADEVLGAASFLHDISARKEAERALIEAQRQQSLAILSGSIAHDFNNILATVLGNANLALEVSEPAAVDKCLREIQAVAEHASELTRQLLAYAGKGRFVVKPVVVNELLEDIGGLLKVAIPRGITIRYQLAEELEAIEVDVAQMRQVIMNLLTNAAEAIGADDSGSITVSTYMLDVEDSLLARAIGRASTGRHVVLSVSDTGCGMSPDEVAKMFDPFFTTKERGHGLGLAATIGIVEGHGGAILVESQKGEGTTIQLLFPAASSVEDASVVQEDPAALPERETIMVVDDEPAILDLMARAMEFFDYDAVLCKDGQDAVEVFAARHEEISAVILDLTMPRMGGKEALAKIREIDADAKVVLTSGYNEQDTVLASTSANTRFIQKPVRISALMELLREMLDAPASDGERA